jgi:hypothetical protein
MVFRLVRHCDCTRNRSGGCKAKKRMAEKGTTRQRAAKRELINTGTDKRFVRRRAAGRFKESDNVGKSLAAGRPQKAQTLDWRAS